MGGFWDCVCDNCGYKVETSGPWDFYRDTEGKRKTYGHPKPYSREAKDIPANTCHYIGERYLENV